MTTIDKGVIWNNMPKVTITEKLKLLGFFPALPLIHPHRSAGFTLIELLVVIAVLGVLVVGLMVAINPADKINNANDARVQNDLGALARASEAYSTARSGFYPSSIATLVSGGELKAAPVAPATYTYTYTALPAACTAGTTCTSVTITSPLKSTKYATTPFWRYESSTGKSCAVATAATACP